MDTFGTQAFFMVIAILMLILDGLRGYRMTQRSREGIEDGAYAPVLPSASPVAVEVASEYYIETAWKKKRMKLRVTFSFALLI